MGGIVKKGAKKGFTEVQVDGRRKPVKFKEVTPEEPEPDPGDARSSAIREFVKLAFSNDGWKSGRFSIGKMIAKIPPVVTSCFPFVLFFVLCDPDAPDLGPVAPHGALAAP